MVELTLANSCKAGAWQLQHRACMGMCDSRHDANLCALSCNRSRCFSMITAANWIRQGKQSYTP